ncbi:MAG: BadF/BadG/BcrA/BcrD ATPase family protein, partial [Bacteroidota bacterium]
RENVFLRRLEIIGDAEIAIEGAFHGKAGVILIAGTGSIIFGKDIKRKFIRSGGSGKLIGDEGSGYSIGRKGLAVVAKEFDGRGKKTLLTKILGEKFGINNRDNLITKVYNEGFDIASAARDVIAAASKGDKICRKILNEEINELLLHIKAVKKNFNEKKIKLAFGGGLLASKNYYSQELRSKIKRTFKNVELKKAIYPPEIGAALLAIKSSSSE